MTFTIFTISTIPGCQLFIIGFGVLLYNFIVAHSNKQGKGRRFIIFLHIYIAYGLNTIVDVKI
jgi:hypothetical protein